MIPALACQMLNARVAPSLPEWLPAGATALLDFVGGNYYAGGAPRSVAQVMSGYDPSALSGIGLHFVNDGNSWLPIAIGAFFNDLSSGLSAGCSIVFDMDFGNPPYGMLMFLGDNIDLSTSANGITVEVDSKMMDLGMLEVGTDLSTTGVHKLAITLNRDVGGGNFEYAWSQDGATALTQTVAYAASWPLDTVAFGCDGRAGIQLDNVWLRSITLYPAKLPADLPALTDLPTT